MEIVLVKKGKSETESSRFFLQENKLRFYAVLFLNLTKEPAFQTNHKQHRHTSRRFLVNSTVASLITTLLSEPIVKGTMK
jgi:hypothetical protein